VDEVTLAKLCHQDMCTTLVSHSFSFVLLYIFYLLNLQCPNSQVLEQLLNRNLYNPLAMSIYIRGDNHNDEV
jgi:hypothetical protein